MNAASILLEDIREALTVEAVLAWAGLDGDTQQELYGDWHGKRCPSGEYHGKSSRAFVIDPDQKVWICNCCGTRGDLLELIAIKLGITTKGPDFNRVKAVAAEIGGVTARRLTAEERDQRDATHREERERKARGRMERLQQERAWGIEHATAYWTALQTRNKAGEHYLRKRYLIGAVERGLVRFDLMGEWLSAGARDSIATPVFTDDGKIVNIKRRRLPQYVHGPDGQRFSPMHRYVSAYGYGTYVGSISDVEAGRDVVLSEGFADSLTAALAWPENTVIGAQSCTELPELAKAIAPRVSRYGGRMMICPHHDNDGIRHAIRAGEIAIEAGLRIDETLVIVKYPAKDLNDAWRTGWSP